MCNCNKLIHKVTSATTDGTNVILSFSTPINVVDTQPFSFVICTSLPSTTAPQQVFITVNGTNVPLLNAFANAVYSNEIRKRKLYIGYFGSQTTPHIIAHNLGKCICG